MNPMLLPRESFIENTIRDNPGEKKSLSEWLELTNRQTPIPKRFTKNSFAHNLRKFAFEKETTNTGVYYLFL